MNKIVTICGSMRFEDKMMEISKELEIKNKLLFNVFIVMINLLKKNNKSYQICITIKSKLVMQFMWLMLMDILETQQIKRLNMLKS